MANTLTTIAPVLYAAAQEVAAEPFGVVDAINAKLLRNRVVNKRDRQTIAVRKNVLLDEEFKAQADDRLRLSSLTLPHGMARLLLCEQLYRAVSVLKNHPYHREG